MRLSLPIHVVVNYCMLICIPVLYRNKEAGIDNVLHFPTSFFSKDSDNYAEREERLH